MRLVNHSTNGIKLVSTKDASSSITIENIDCLGDDINK